MAHGQAHGTSKLQSFLHISSHNFVALKTGSADLQACQQHCCCPGPMYTHALLLCTVCLAQVSLHAARQCLCHCKNFVCTNASGVRSGYAALSAYAPPAYVRVHICLEPFYPKVTHGSRTLRHLSCTFIRCLARACLSYSCALFHKHLQFMFVAHWSAEDGAEWSSGAVVPYGPLELEPAAQVSVGLPASRPHSMIEHLDDERTVSRVYITCNE